MKLRSKNTGKIIHAYPVIRICDGETEICYHSINELNECWEDVEKPLIEDDDARKSLFNWASANQVHKVKCEFEQRRGVDITRFIAIEYMSQSLIEFRLLDANVKDGCEYNIAELCGEEE